MVTMLMGEILKFVHSKSDIVNREHLFCRVSYNRQSMFKDSYFKVRLYYGRYNLIYVLIRLRTQFGNESCMFYWVANPVPYMNEMNEPAIRLANNINVKIYHYDY